MSSNKGRIVSLHLSRARHEPNTEVQTAEFLKGRGISGDHHANDRKNRSGYQVLIIDKETLDQLGVTPGKVREQVTTEGITITGLESGQLLALGDSVLIRIFKPAIPCSRMDEITPGLQERLEGRRGMLAEITSSGIVQVGDPISIIP